MKKHFYILLLTFLIAGCSDENGNNSIHPSEIGAVAEPPNVIKNFAFSALSSQAFSNMETPIFAEMEVRNQKQSSVSVNGQIYDLPYVYCYTEVYEESDETYEMRYYYGSSIRLEGFNNTNADYAIFTMYETSYDAFVSFQKGRIELGEVYSELYLFDFVDNVDFDDDFVSYEGDLYVANCIENYCSINDNSDTMPVSGQMHCNIFEDYF